MGDLLDKLVKEDRLELRDFKVEQSKALNEILNRYQKLYSLMFSYDAFQLFNNCEHVLHNFKDYNYKDITSFSLLLNQIEKKETYNPFCTGVYLSALINRCPDKDYFISTQYINEEIPYLGFLLNDNKKVTIIGNARQEVGACMVNGILTITGDVPYQGTGYGLCYNMDGGSIIIKGKFDTAYISRNMNCGEVIVEYNNADQIYYRALKKDFYIKGMFHKDKLPLLRSLYDPNYQSGI